jgi:hypothetical protein
VDWAQESGWEKLCALAGKDIPDVPFPHANKGGYGKPSALKRVADRLRRAPG